MADKSKTDINDAKKAMVINVISGKGGTGKTLLTTAIAYELAKNRHKVLVIDLDIAVRGLSLLLSVSKSNIWEVRDTTQKDTASVYEFLTSADSNTTPSLSQYSNNFYVLPAVNNIRSDAVDFAQAHTHSLIEWENKLRGMLEAVEQSGENFDYIFLDNRAGYDDIIGAAHIVSDFSLLIAEDDRIARFTANNLGKKLESLKGEGTASYIVLKNKSRHYNAEEQPDIGSTYDVRFDMDVMDLFGTSDFPSNMSGTVFYSDLIDAWNGIAAAKGLSMLGRKGRRNSAIPQNVNKRMTALSSRGRFFFASGFIMALISVLVLLLDRIDLESLTTFLDMLKNLLPKSPAQILALSTSLLSLSLMCLGVVISGGRRKRAKKNA